MTLSENGNKNTDVLRKMVKVNSFLLTDISVWSATDSQIKPTRNLLKLMYPLKSLNVTFP